MSKKTILSVDDSPTIIKIIQEVLEEHGFNVITAYDGNTGIQKAKDENPDLIIFDVMMPGIDGFKACELLKRDPLTKDIPLIILSARDMGDDFDTAMQKKADWYIVKPFNEEHLMKVINKLLPV